jgi:hypothetical protein
MRRTIGLAMAAGLLALLPTSSARAQAAYGYDSWVYGLPSGASYWNSAGYPGVYTDRTTNSFVGNEVGPYRPAVPYMQPPAGTFGRGDGLASAAAAMPAAPVAAAPAAVRPQPARVQRRPLMWRLRGRR